MEVRNEKWSSTVIVPTTLKELIDAGVKVRTEEFQEYFDKHNITKDVMDIKTQVEITLEPSLSRGIVDQRVNIAAQLNEDKNEWRIAGIKMNSREEFAANNDKALDVLKDRIPKLDQVITSLHNSFVNDIQEFAYKELKWNDFNEAEATSERER